MRVGASVSSGTAQEEAVEDAALLRDLYRRMSLIRQFEDAVQELFLAGHVYGTTHLYSGQEAVAVGFGSVLTDVDRVAATYRGHGHALSLGVSPQALLDEMLGRATGINGGRAGSMNVVAPEHRLLGCYGIVGGSIATATGAGLSLRDRGGVAVAFFGDGATNHGYFHECLNFAQVFRLPAVYVCENNKYAEYTPADSVTAGEIIERARSYGIKCQQSDGMDVWAVRATASEAITHARAGKGPVFVEALTYRFVGHSRSDPARYRPPGELDAWKKRDPLLIARERLTALGVTPEELDRVDDEIRECLERCRANGLAAPWPDPASQPKEFCPQKANE